MGVNLELADYDWEQKKNQLEEMIATSEDTYGLLSRKLPQLEQEIEETIEETELLINYFIATDTEAEADNQQAQIAEVLDRLEAKVEQVYESLTAQEEIYELLAGFINQEQTEEAEFNQILGIIDQLNDVLIDLEVLSINAIIFSAQQKEAGEAFRVISEEINNLSGELKSRYQTTGDSLHTLQDWYEEFTANLQELIKLEEEIGEKYETEIEEVFTEVITSLQTVTNILEDFMAHIQQAVEPIYGIVVELQNQDLIRQNLEQVAEIIEVLEQETANGEQLSEAEEELNTAIFIAQVTEMAQDLLGHVLEQLEASLFKIETKFSRLENNLDQMEEEGDQIFAFLAGEEAEGSLVDGRLETTSIDLIYQQVINFLPQLINDLDRVTGKYQRIIENRSVFYSNLEQVEEEFTAINGIADRFEKLEMMARIELARMNNQNNSVIHNIGEAIASFINANKENQQLFNNLQQELAVDYDQFITLSQQDKEKIDSSYQIIAESQEKLLMTKKLVKDANQSLHQSFNSLIDKILEINEEVQEVNHLETKGEQLISDLNRLQQEAQQLIETHLQQSSRQEEQLTDARLRKIRDELADYIEQDVSSTVDTEDETADREGDLTLF